MERFGIQDPLSGYYFIMESLQKIVNEENAQLKNGYPIIQVLNSLVEKIDSSLREASQSQQVPMTKKHVPEW